MFPCIFCCYADICFWCTWKKSFSKEACDWTWSRRLSSVHYWLRQNLEITTITQPTIATPRSTVKTPAMTPSTSKNTGKCIFSVRITSVLPPNNTKVILPLNAAERKWLRQLCGITVVCFYSIFLRHKSLEGVSQASVEYQALQLVSSLNFYGVEWHSSRDSEGQELLIGVGPEGLFVCKTDFTPIERCICMTRKRRNIVKHQVIQRFKINVYNIISLFCLSESFTQSFKWPLSLEGMCMWPLQKTVGTVWFFFLSSSVPVLPMDYIVLSRKYMPSTGEYFYDSTKRTLVKRFQKRKLFYNQGCVSQKHPLKPMELRST